jgi:outer membrane immunogenic protein
MKRIAAAAAILLMAPPAFAADSIMASSAYDWAGPYAGVQAGYVWGDDTLIIPNYPSSPLAMHSDGALLGAFAGYNYQVDRFILGAEVGINWVGASDSVPTYMNPTESFNVDQEWEASIVARAGVPVDNLLVYALGGASFTHLSGHYSDTIMGVAPSASETVAGYTLGAGVEYKFSPSMSTRVEYRFADYANADLTCVTCGPTSVDLTTHTVTVGAAFHY